MRVVPFGCRGAYLWERSCAHEEKGTVEAFDEDDNIIELKTNEDEHLSAFVFKTIIDPFVGKISYIKVMSGVLTFDSEIYNVQKRETERINAIHIINGKLGDTWISF